LIASIVDLGSSAAVWLGEHVVVLIGRIHDKVRY
jgi:hypothetical protein